MPVKISTLSTTPVRFSRASNAVKNGGTVLFQTYSSRSDQLGLEINVSQTPGFQITDAGTKTNITVEKQSGDSAQDVSFRKYIYQPGQAAPLIYTPTPYGRFTASAANGLATFDSVTYDLSAFNYMYVVYRNNTAALAAGDLIITLRSSAGNESVCTSSKTTSAAGDWTYETFEFQNDAAANVAIALSPVFTGITEVDVEVAVSGDVIDVDKIYFVQNWEQLPISVLTEDLGNNCLTEMSMAFNIDTFEQMCGLDVIGMQASGYKPEFEFSVPSSSIQLKALANGATAKSLSVNDVDTREYTVSSGSIATGSAIGAGNARLDVAEVYVGSQKLLRAYSSDLIDTMHYYVNPATGAIAVNTQYNGATAKVTFNIQTDQDAYRVEGNKVGYIGKVLVKMVENGRINTKSFIGQLMPGDPDFANDNDIVDKYRLKLIDDDGVKFTEAIR